MSNIIKKIVLNVKDARNLMRIIQASQERQKKVEIRRLKRVRCIFEEKTGEYGDALQEIQEDYSEKVEEANALPNQEFMVQLNRLNIELNKKVEDLNKTVGEVEIELKLTPDDFSYLRSKWDKCDDFLPSSDVQDFVESIDGAFESVEDIELDKLRVE